MPEAPERSPDRGLSRVGVTNFKSVSSTQWLTLKPLTLIAGANSSGKSTLVQPLLLIKQTLESRFDPGPLLLDGPNFSVDSASEFASLVPGADRTKFQFSFEGAKEQSEAFTLTFRNDPHLTLERMAGCIGNQANQQRFELSLDASQDDLLRFVRDYPPLRTLARGDRIELTPRGCFFWIVATVGGFPSFGALVPSLSSEVFEFCRRLLHLPGLRGNPERAYRRAAVSDHYPGRFDAYAASVLLKWQEHSAKEKIEELNELLRLLDLTWKAEATPLGDTRVALRVGRLPEPGPSEAPDLVSIADVGLGVSQSFPLLTALVAAQPGDTIYVEQPEIHLHPRAQQKLGQALQRAVKRGVHVMVETHSPILLREIQTSIALGELRPEEVAMHWCTRDRETGATTVHLAELGPDGSFGDWPSDFGRVALQSTRRYLDAAEQRMLSHA